MRKEQGFEKYSCLVKPARSLRSAPAQKDESTSLVRIRTLVDPFPPSCSIAVTCWLNSLSNCLEIAFRALGRLSAKILIEPECGAGTMLTLITDGTTDDVALRRICCRNNVRKALRLRSGDGRIIQRGRFAVKRDTHVPKCSRGTSHATLRLG